MTAHDDAVKAAAEALDTYAAGYLIQRGHIDLDDIRIAVAAAAPILLAAERARIAAAIWADCWHTRSPCATCHFRPARLAEMTGLDGGDAA